MDVLEPIRAAVEWPEWVSENRRLDAVFVGSSQLLVVVTVAPVSALTNGEGCEVAVGVCDGGTIS